MPHDYKTVGRKKSTSPPTPGWVWLLIGLAIGLFVALMIYVGGYAPDTKTGFVTTLPSEVSSPQKVDTRAVRKSEVQATDFPPAPPEPRFDFYTLLPEMEVAVPEREVTGAPQQGLPQVDQPGIYILQAGSFRDLASADRLKANLILQDIEASIQTVTIDDKETWHRVHIGPYDNLIELNEVRFKLKKNNIEAILLQVKS